MPIYVWRCEPCNREHERIVSNWFDATKAKLKCDDCGSVMERQVTAASPQFKGSGFYHNDYKNRP